MTCDDYRDYWHAAEPGEVAIERVGAHADSCEPCRLWERRQRAFEDRLGAAIVAEPPAELILRLSQIPQAALATSRATAPVSQPVDSWAWGVWLETGLLLLVGLAALTLTGFDPLATAAVLIARLSDVFQAIPLIFNAPLFSYIESFTFTIVEAMATLILIALGLLQAGPSLFGGNQRTDTEAG